MHRNLLIGLIVLSLAWASVGLPEVSRADDYVLTIGGGYSPTGNQISLERNVLFLQRLLAQEKTQGTPLDVYFADGDSPQRDVQFVDVEHPVPPANLWMARLFGKEGYLGLSYRSHELPGVRGASSPENIEAWFRNTGSKLRPGDRLILYVTAHGGKSGDKENAFNTHVWLWDEQKLHEKELAKHLDTLPDGVSVAVVMVQCYCGGFSHLIFNEGDAKKGLSPRSRCGFFATVHDRPAAGCTADINEEDYQEYSSFFWAALGGKRRTGAAIDKPDYDGDGAISFEEAHAYTMIASDSIDIPVKTSGAYLRVHSKTHQDGRDDLISPDAPYPALLALAGPADAAVLEGLSTQLNLSADERTKEARELAESVEKERKSLGKTHKKQEQRWDEMKKQVQHDLRARWPELANVLDPRVTDLLTAHSQEFMQAVESHKHFSEMVQVHKTLDDLDAQRLDLQRRWAKCQRFVRVAENVALAANLPKLASPEIQQHYRELVALERSTLQMVNHAEPAAQAAGK